MTDLEREALCYAVTIVEDADEGFIPRMPAFPRIYTNGDMPAEALANAYDALALTLEWCYERGLPTPATVPISEAGLADFEAAAEKLAAVKTTSYRMSADEFRQGAAVWAALLTADGGAHVEPPVVSGEQARATEAKLAHAGDDAERLFILCREPSGVPIVERAHHRARLLEKMGFEAAAAVMRQRAISLAAV
jgi:predicted RNase H-like HicB family nuclease